MPRKRFFSEWLALFLCLSFVIGLGLVLATDVDPTYARFQSPPPVNDDFDDAGIISGLPFTESLDTNGATAAADDPISCTNNGSVWYAFTPLADMQIEANTLGSSYDTVLSVYTGERGGLEQVPGACNDDFNGVQSRVTFNATAGTTYYLLIGFCCGIGESGGGNLVFTVQEFLTIGSIGGRVIDAVSETPLPGNDFPFTFVELRLCDPSGCFSPVNSQATDNEGRFLFERDFNGNPLGVGTYQVAIFANLYEPGLVDVFDLDEGEHREVGDIPLNPMPTIGSISGRVVDAATGAPLPGDTPPFALVELLHCDAFGCYIVSSQPTDQEGLFSFERDFAGGPFPAGTYQIQAFAQEYQMTQTDPFDVGEAEHRDVGAVGLQPFPVRFSEIRPCGDLPPEGGRCRYSVRVTNQSDTSLNGTAWSLIDSFGIGSLTDFTVFQSGKKNVSLRSGRSEVVRFNFNVPHTVRDGAIICAQVFVGQERRDPFFNTIGQRNLFCILKGFTGFSVLSERESQQLYRQMKQPMLTPSQLQRDRNDAPDKNGRLTKPKSLR